MAVATWQLGRSALAHGLTVVLAATSAVLLVRYRTNAAWQVLGGTALGLLVTGLSSG